MARNTASTKVQEYKDGLKKKAEDLVLNGFPEKILELNELLQSPQLNQRNMDEIHVELNVPVPDPIALNNSSDEVPAKRKKLDPACSCVEGTRVLLLSNGSVPCNRPLCELIGVVKPHLRQLVENANLVKMWISYMIPKIEDGNNFGVSIQEETLAEVTAVESEGAVFFDQISRYFVARGKLVSKVAKWPHIEDYRRAVRELDEKQYLSLWLVMCEIRNRYCTLHDLVIKNLEKIKKPSVVLCERACVRLGGKESYACVCNASYCDSYQRIEQFDSGKLYLYVSGRDAGRMELSEVSMAPRTSLINDPDYTVSVSTAEQRQEVFGFGGAMTDSAAAMIHRLPLAAQDRLMKMYFSPQQLGYSFIRVPVASTDFSSRAYSYDDYPQDKLLARFQLTPEDLADKIPLIRAAQKAAESEIKLIGGAWSAPAWMKNDSMILSGGFIKQSAYRAWARYYIKFLKAYRKEGLSFWGLTNGNEPGLAVVSPSWTADQLKRWIHRNVGPELSRHFPTVRLLLLDDLPERVPEYLPVLEDEKAAKYISGWAVHPYSKPGYLERNMELAHNRFPDRFILLTEFSVGIRQPDPVALGSWTRAEAFATRIIVGLQHWATGFLDWNLALDPDGGPTFIGNNLDAAVIVKSSAGEWYKQPALYIMAHFSAFITPNSRVLQVQVQPAGLLVTAAVTPEGRVVVVFLNTDDLPVKSLLSIGDGADGLRAVVELPSRSIATALYKVKA